MKRLLWVSLLLLACNDGALVSSPTPYPKPTAVVTPTPPIKVPLPTDHDCGNADYVVFDTYDPDDNPGYADSYWCYWACAIDQLDANPPHEVLKHYDYDAPQPAYQFDSTVYLPCYSLVP